MQRGGGTLGNSQGGGFPNPKKREGFLKRCVYRGGFFREKWPVFVWRQFGAVKRDFRGPLGLALFMERAPVFFKGRRIFWAGAHILPPGRKVVFW